MKCSSSERVTASLLLSFLVFASTTSGQQLPLQPPQQTALASTDHTFTLRHIFHRGTYKYPNLHRRLDIRPEDEFTVSYDDEPPIDVAPPRFNAKSAPIEIERLVDRRHAQIEGHLEYASLTGMARVLDAEHWTTDEVDGPDVEDKDTVVNLASMAANAYVPKYKTGNWEDVGPPFNVSADFGWEGDGLRGHIFADEKNETIVVGLKGTSVAVFDGEGTTTPDKVNDNLFFSCCCGQGGNWLWKQACNCQTDTYTCNSTCVVRALHKKTRYYSAAMELYTNITELYPTSNIWIVGHSLGGSVSSLLGLSYGVPVVTFEAPGEDLAARRLGLPIPGEADRQHPFQRRLTGAKHFGHTADPVFMGSCNGALSLCSLGGYAMESQCHTGTRCVYDTVTDLGWSVSLLNHKITTVIADVLKAYKHVPKCEPDPECRDCDNWKFFDSNNTDPRVSKTTTSQPTSTFIVTRTEICKNPGWWGCLDPTSTPVTTTVFTTTTCVSPGWFGCNSEVTSTVTTTTAIPTSMSTSTCETPGLFWGCWDDSTSHSPKSTSHISTTPPMTASVTTTSTTSDSSTCISSCDNPGMFWGCWDEPTSKCKTTPTVTSRPALGPSKTRTTTVPTNTSKTVSATRTHKTTSCTDPGLFWGCWDGKTHAYTSTAIATSSVEQSISSSIPTATASPSCKRPGYIWGCRD